MWTLMSTSEPSSTHTQVQDQQTLLHQEAPRLARAGRGGGELLLLRSDLIFCFICNTLDRGKGHRVVICNWVQHLWDVASNAE